MPRNVTYPGLLLLMLAITAFLGGLWLLFRIARRDGCAWPRNWRIIAQAPGWGMVVLGGYVVIGLAVLEVREKRAGLGLGTVIAAAGSLLKALTGGADEV